MDIDWLIDFIYYNIDHQKSLELIKLVTLPFKPVK